MAAVPVKPAYRPTMGDLLAPRWRAASRRARTVAVVSGAALLAAVVGAALTLENAHFAHAGRVPFSFSYRDLYRVRPDPGGYVKVQGRWPDGALKYSFAVDPLALPPYAGAPQGELPLYATGFIEALRARYDGFELRGEGKTRINNTLAGYQVAFSARVRGRRMYARYVLLLPPTEHPRAGVVVAMLASPAASATVDSPLEVAATGVLLRPLKTFAFG